MDGVVFDEGQTVDDISNLLESHFDIRYPVKWEVQYEEDIDD